jgi:PAS domain S-box-containing protein
MPWAHLATATAAILLSIRIDGQTTHSASFGEIVSSGQWYILGGLLILGQTFLILELLRHRARRKKMQADLTVANDQLRLALEAGHSVGWDWDVKTGRDQWFGDLQSIFGIPADSYSGNVEEFHARIHSEDRKVVGHAVAEARRLAKPYTAEFRVIRPDGSVRWLTATGKFYYGPDNQAERMLGIAVDITERKHIHEALRASEEKFSKAFRQSPMALTLSRVRDSRYIEVNEAFERVTGWNRSEVIGRTPFEVGLWKNSTQRDDLVSRLLKGEVVRDFAFHARTRAGEERTALGSAELIEVEGETCVLSVAADITELKRVEATLRESEERFRLVANTAPVVIWMSDADSQCTYVNKSWLEYTGGSFEDQLGDGWVQSLHPEDRNRSWEIYRDAFNRREYFQMEYRLRRADGEYRWFFDSGVPRDNADGSFAGYIGSAIDVTERKLAEDTLSMVSRRLIEAQEDERARIARELHDDISQRLSLLVLNLERSRRSMPATLTQAVDTIGETIKLALEISSDTQALSHRLHSSKLELLGLSAASASYCRELADQRGVMIDFLSETLPSNLAPEVALCLFRVLQEALQNAIKHSGTTRFQVSFRTTPTDISLTVHDSGKGFDAAKINRGRGLGITSMKERMKLIHGQIRIDSQIHRGTTVRASVPLDALTKVADSAV